MVAAAVALPPAAAGRLTAVFARPSTPRLATAGTPSLAEAAGGLAAAAPCLAKVASGPAAAVPCLIKTSGGPAILRPAAAQIRCLTYATGGPASGIATGAAAAPRLARPADGTDTDVFEAAAASHLAKWAVVHAAVAAAPRWTGSARQHASVVATGPHRTRPAEGRGSWGQLKKMTHATACEGQQHTG